MANSTSSAALIELELEEQDPIMSKRSHITSDQEKSKDQTQVNEQMVDEVNEDEADYLTSWKLFILIFGLCLNVFCLALDNTIITTAIPKITDHFNSLGDVGWYGSAYFLTTCTVTLMFGRLYTFFSTKWVYLSALFLFEVGSLICGVTPTSVGLIIGRAIAGMGAGGLLSGSLIITSRTVPLQKRALYIGIVASAYGIANVIGPLLGGALTDSVSWRWCFYINLPLSVLPALVILIFFNPRTVRSKLTTSQKLLRMDPVGNLLFMSAVICLLLAIEWGGQAYSWKNARIIVLFILSGLLTIVFLAFERLNSEHAMLPFHLLKKRGVYGSAWFAFFLGGSYSSATYYLPLWFQAIRGKSATMSGVMTLPLILGLTICSVLSGFLVSRIGYYNPLIILGCIITTIGAGTLTTLQVHSGHAAWIGYQALFGIGVGLCVQLPFTIVQRVVVPAHIPTVTSFITFIQNMGSSVFLGVSQNVFQAFLAKKIHSEAPSVSISNILKTGTTGLTKNLDPDVLPDVLHAYNEAIMTVFYLCLVLAGLAVFGTLILEWQSVRDKKIEAVLA